MTRPMPGPPEDWWYCTPPHGEPGLCTSDMDPAEYMPFTHLQHKRLTDAEAAAEYWQAATASERVRAVCAITRDPGECITTNVDFLRVSREQVTWHRFATLPHALEMTP